MNNADSFAIAFDDIWKRLSSNEINPDIDLNEKINIALSKINDHPFLKNFPSKARDVAEFRIRLLNLE